MTAARVGLIDDVAGDRAFDAVAFRSDMLDPGVVPQVPSKRNRTDPWPLYRERSRVERLYAELKGFRRVAARCDKFKASYLGFIHLALGLIRMRAEANVNRP